MYLFLLPNSWFSQSYGFLMFMPTKIFPIVKGELNWPNNNNLISNLELG